MEKKIENRRPAVAGQFYPGSQDELKKEVAGLFQKAKPCESSDVLAIICPHAGYVYSGQVAATSFNQIDKEKEYENIFVIGSTHSYPFDGASVYNIGNYSTPLGTVEVNIELANELIKKHEVFSFQRDIDSYEHSVEVQLPFLQHIMKKKFKIVPIVVGAQNQETCKQIAEALKPYFSSKNLFVISTDFSHYPDYKNAVIVDKATADAIVSNSPEQLMNTISSNSAKKIRNLSTSVCGWTSVLTLLYITQEMKEVQYKQIQYRNSGDVSGDSSRVVGYWSIAVSGKISQDAGMGQKKDSSDFFLADEEKIALLKLARATIIERLEKDKVSELKDSDFSETVRQHLGAFVTLHKDGELRGCIGRFLPEEPLYSVVQDMAISAALFDSRFMPVTAKEITQLEIEISVLSPLKQISSLDEFELGKHGIYIKKGFHSGTYLPQVAKETKWTKEEFVSHCSQYKAGLGADGWKDADLFIYEANVFSEKEFPELWPVKDKK
ncbi:MAG: AmmeMemoRadiSam system protein B [Bacteroidia bacterium]|nr:AmmeMemoRadiSam system protein B [Bacteroidia bacterium]